MAAIGASGTNAFTSYDVTCYTEDIPSNQIENWARIQADRFEHRYCADSTQSLKQSMRRRTAPYQ